MIPGIDTLGFGAFALALCLAQPALAQIATTTLGKLTASIDGVPYAGETLDVPSEGTSTAEFTTFGPMTSFTIQAHDPLSENIMNNVLAIEISLLGSDASTPVMEASVSWWPEGMSKPFYLSEDSGTDPEIVIGALSLQDGASSIEGRFSALICRKDSFFAETDTSDCLPVEGAFDTALRNAD